MSKMNDPWVTAPISPTCEVLKDINAKQWDEKFCGAPTACAYPAMNGGWMALCHEHGRKHPEAPHIDNLILKGERFA